MLERVKEVVASVTQEDYSATPADAPLGLDSIKRISLIVALEGDFDIEIDSDSMEPEIFDTLGSLTAFIQSKLG